MKALTKEYWSEEIQKLNRWVHLHPFKFCAFTALFIFCGALFEECDWRLSLAVTFASWLVLNLCVILDLKRMVPLLVAGALALSQPLRAEEPAPQPAVQVGIAAGVVVIVGGVWVVCKIVNFCKRKFPKGGSSTNQPPEETSSEYGAMFSWTDPGYCVEEFSPASVAAAPTVFTLRISVESASNATVTCSAFTGHEFTQTWEEFQEEMAGHGLFGQGSPSSCFELGGEPAKASDVPITFNFDTKTATIGPGGILLTVKRSDDLNRWETFARFNVEEGARLELPDVSTKMQFYRIEVTQP